MALVDGSLNYTYGHSVDFSGGADLVADPGRTGPLTMSGGIVQIGVGSASAGASELTVAGAVTLNSTSQLSMFINRAGTAAGTDYSQLSATGNVDLGSATLFLGGRSGSCSTLNVGDVLTLVTSTGSLTGTFAGVPNGSTVSVVCSGTEPTVRINYTSNTVTATVLTSGGSGTPTTTTLSNSPASPVTNQTVTLTATVGPNSASPAGTVEFANDGTPIAAARASRSPSTAPPTRPPARRRSRPPRRPRR